MGFNLNSNPQNLTNEPSTVLDAVATLLRGPIRSAIANRGDGATRRVEDLSVAENREAIQ